MITQAELCVLARAAVEKQVEASTAARALRKGLAERVDAARELVEQPLCDPELAELAGAYLIHLGAARRLGDTLDNGMVLILCGLTDWPLLRARVLAALHHGAETAQAECGCDTCAANRAHAVATVEASLARARGGTP